MATTTFRNNMVVTGDLRVDGSVLGNNDASVSLTASAAVPAGTRAIELSHATVAIAATLDLDGFRGFLFVKNTSASGTAAHTLTVSNGTLNGTNTVATLNAPNEALMVYVDSAGNGTIIENIGTVGLA